jgi:predicted DNA-binding transcriptional regulator YafY
MRMAIHEYELSAAIHGRRCVRFRYRGETRIVEPYAFGIDAGGDPILRAFELGGEDDPHHPGWALFHAAEIDQLALLDRTFAEPREGYLRNDPAMTKVYAEL